MSYFKPINAIDAVDAFQRFLILDIRKAVYFVLHIFNKNDFTVYSLICFDLIPSSLKLNIKSLDWSSGQISKQYLYQL